MLLLRWHGQLILLNFLMFMSWRPCRGLNVPSYGTTFRANPTRRSGALTTPQDSAYYDDAEQFGPEPVTRNQRRSKLTAISNPDFYFPPDPEADLAEDAPDPVLERQKPRATAAQGAFSYNPKDKNGPSHWHRVDARCGGRYQSPILLNTSSALLVGRKRPLRLDGQTNLPQTILLQNDGHSAKFTYNWRNGDRPVLHGGPLKTKYLFDQFHFHWGGNSTVGSEHVYDYQRYPMEIHLVFYNGLYESFQAAREQVDGIAVVGLFYEIYQHSVDEQLNTWTRFLRNVIVPSSEYTIPFIDTFPLYEVIGDVEWPYFTYEGSLTTPPCLETVTWVVSTKPLLVTEREMRLFRRLQSPTGQMVNNFRPVQKLNHRRVFLY